MLQTTPVYRVTSVDPSTYELVPNTYDIVTGLIRDPVLADSTDLIFVVDKPNENRLDLISQSFYGTPELWWVLAMVNNMRDAQFGIPYGTRLRIPLRSRMTNLQILQQ